MNWYKISQNNSITILSYSDGGYLNVLDGNGKTYTYYGANPGIIKKLQRLIKQNRIGEGWQLLRRLTYTGSS